MPKSLIIVESQAKTKTISSFLGPDFECAASLGHVRDLPKSGLGVDVDGDFAPTYQVLKDKQDVVKQLQAKAKKADRVYLATDPDREGEAIAWHLEAALRLKDPLRIEFNEITRAAVEEALRHPRHIDENRVNAQQARRVLDRLVGYRLSPLLWRKVRNARSAGRVQSVAVRLIVEREREIRAFEPQEFWRIAAVLHPENRPEERFEARLEQVNGQKVDVGTIPDEATALALVAELEQAAYRVINVGTRASTRSAPPPHITSTLQRDASSKLSFRAQRTMSTAQKLYEGLPLGGGEPVGMITYMRTDSTRVADEARQAASQLITDLWGKDYVGKGARGRKVKGAQDAHECIRPTNVNLHPDEVDKQLSGRDNLDARRLYRLIWTRFMASQMAPAKLETLTIDIGAGNHLFRASGTKVLFPGYMALTGLPARTVRTDEAAADDDDNAGQDDDMDLLLPQLAEGEAVGLDELKPTQHFTQPPPRYSESSLVKALEERGIGRPSTYAPILSTITARGYVRLDQRAFVPTPLGEAVTDALVERFPTVLDVDFTAELEEDLDDVEQGKQDWVKLLRDFYQPFQAQIDSAMTDMEFVRIEAKPTEFECPKCGAQMVERHGRYGPFLGCSKYPECNGILKLDKEGKPSVPFEPIQTDVPCPKCDKPMVVRMSRRGPFLGCTGYPKCRGTRKLDAAMRKQLEAKGLELPPDPVKAKEAEEAGE